MKLIIPLKFKKFLDDHCVYDIWYKNTSDYLYSFDVEKRSIYIENIQTCFNTSKFDCRILLHTFPFYESKEGVDYWNKLARELYLYNMKK